MGVVGSVAAPAGNPAAGNGHCALFGPQFTSPVSLVTVGLATGPTWQLPCSCSTWLTFAAYWHGSKFVQMRSMKFWLSLELATLPCTPPPPMSGCRYSVEPLNMLCEGLSWVPAISLPAVPLVAPATGVVAGTKPSLDALIEAAASAPPGSAAANPMRFRLPSQEFAITASAMFRPALTTAPGDGIGRLLSPMAIIASPPTLGV